MRVIGVLVTAIVALVVVGFVATMFVRVPGGLASYGNGV